MRLYGLIGYPLGHSFSARFFAEKFSSEQIDDCAYRNFPIPDINQLPRLLHDHPDLRGFNVTIPYKELIRPYLDEIDPEADAIGAVNCVRIHDGRLQGYNTDVYGFRASLLNLLGPARPDALVLGTGGASKAVRFVLDGLGIRHQTISRTAGTGKIAYTELTPEIAAAHPLIINTTPLGTFPDTGGCPALPYAALTPSHFLFDLVYNPPLTEFLRRGQAQGAAIMNGYDMLVGQAIRSWEIWQETGR